MKNGLMIKQGSYLSENNMHFESDKNQYAAKNKAERIKKQRKNGHRIIRDELENG